KLGEDVTETLESVPRQWKVVQYVREKFTCRTCEAISQTPAPFHVLPRGFAGPSLLAMIAFEKYGQHQPLNRQAERYAREGVDLSLSTLADEVGGCAAVLHPIYDLICAHVFAGSRVHRDDTTVPVLAKGQTVTGRLWTYVRDDRPFGGRDPPAAVFFYSRDRAGDHPERHLHGYTGILQADAYGAASICGTVSVGAASAAWPLVAWPLSCGIVMDVPGNSGKPPTTRIVCSVGPPSTLMTFSSSSLAACLASSQFLVSVLSSRPV